MWNIQIKVQHFRVTLTMLRSLRRCFLFIPTCVLVWAYFSKINFSIMSLTGFNTDLLWKTGGENQLSNALVMSSHFVFPLKISNLHQHCCSVEWHDDKRVRPWLQSCSATGDCFLGVSHAIFFEFRIWLIEKTYIVDGIGWTLEKLIFVRLCWNIYYGFELVQATSADLR